MSIRQLAFIKRQSGLWMKLCCPFMQLTLWNHLEMPLWSKARTFPPWLFQFPTAHFSRPWVHQGTSNHPMGLEAYEVFAFVVSGRTHTSQRFGRWGNMYHWMLQCTVQVLLELLQGIIWRKKLLMLLPRKVPRQTTFGLLLPLQSQWNRNQPQPEVSQLWSLKLSFGIVLLSYLLRKSALKTGFNLTASLSLQ